MPRVGSISPKAQAKLNGKLAVLRQTRPQKSKMAAFSTSTKDEGSAHKRAEVPSNEINHPTNQRDRVGSKPSAPGKGKGRAINSTLAGTRSTGGQARGGTAPTRRQIDQGAMQSKKWIPGSNVSGYNPATGNTRMKGPIAQRGPMYGGGGRNTQ